MAKKYILENLVTDCKNISVLSYARWVYANSDRKNLTSSEMKYLLGTLQNMVHCKSIKKVFYFFTYLKKSKSGFLRNQLQNLLYRLLIHRVLLHLLLQKLRLHHFLDYN